MLDLSFYKGKKVLVTGHTGFKGTWLCKILVNAGAKVTGYSLDAPTNPNIFTLSKIEESMNSIIGDIRDYEHLKRVFDDVKPEIVLHLAAQPIVRDSYKEPKYTYETNVLGTVNILECVRLTDSVKSFLNVTTDKVYQNDDIPNHPFKEDEPLDGYDPYSNSKSCSELVTHSYKKSFFTDGRCAISTARAGNVIGGGDFANDRIIPDCVRAIEGNKDIIVRNPHSTRPYQHVLEPLYIYLEICEKQYKDRKYEGYYNVGPDDCDCVNTGDLVTKFCNAWGNNLKWINKYDGGPHEAAFLKLDNTKIKNVFGWKPRWHIDETIAKIVEWTKVYLNNKDDISKEMDKEIKEFIKV
ncbi:MAG: CDP-glucose 4,6-dehydratase [Clostridia bacterium]|nr:CDP-glucose 4,6-dehydratase [Clostridia bacterium]